MFTYIHIMSYYRLFLYFNICLGVKSNNLLCSFTSIYFLTSIKWLPSSGFALHFFILFELQKFSLYILILICGIYQLSKWAFSTCIWNGIPTSYIVFLWKSNKYVPSITLWFGDCMVFSCVCQDHVYCIARENYIQWNLCNSTPEISDILWHPTKMYGPKVFLLIKIKPEYSDILYNPTHFPGPLVCWIRQVPLYYYFLNLFVKNI